MGLKDILNHLERVLDTQKGRTATATLRLETV